MEASLDTPEPRLPAFGLALAIVLLALCAPHILFAHVELMSVREMAAASPNIVVATVEGRQSHWNDLRTLILTDYMLRVEDRLRGGAPDRISITIPGGTLGNVSDDTCISVHLQPGARYLLFLGDLDHPTLTPVTGAEQGMFREVPGTQDGGTQDGGTQDQATATFVTAETWPGPLSFQGRAVTFRDFTGAVRALATKVALAPRLPLAPAAALPVKTWNPAALLPPTAGSLPPRAEPAEGEVTVPAPVADKYLIVQPAKPPIVVNPLTDSEFAPWDQYQMAYWNRYAGNLFRVSAAPTSSWAYGNGVSDIAGFPDDATMTKQFGKNWTTLGEGVLAVTFTHHENGVLLEADTVFNPRKSWTLDDLEATSQAGTAYAFKEVVLHELGHVWGLWHPWDDGAKVTWDSVMNYKPRNYYVAKLFADDTAAVRHAFPPGVSLRDGLISSYVTLWDGLAPSPDYRTPFPTLSSVRPGGGFGLAGPITIENVGTVPLANPAVEVYLAPVRLSFDGAVLVKRAKVRGKVQPGKTLQVKLTGFKVPRGTPAGTYFLAYLLRDPKDAYQGNNSAWGREGVKVTVLP